MSNKPKRRQRMQRNGMLIQQQDENGYNIVWLKKDGVETCHRVDKLVWEAFNGAIPEGSKLEHIDGDKQNNSLNNLRLVAS